MAPQGKKIDARLTLGSGESIDPAKGYRPLGQRQMQAIKKQQSRLTPQAIQKRIQYLANPANAVKVLGADQRLAALQARQVRNSIGAVNPAGQKLFAEARKARQAGQAVDPALQQKLTAIKNRRANRYMAKGNDYYQVGYKKPPTV